VSDAASLKARILASTRQIPSPTRTEGRRVVAIATAISVAAGVAALQALGGLAHSRDRPLSLTFRLAVGWVLASAGLTLVVRKEANPFVRSPDVLGALSVAAPLALAGWLVRFHGASPDVPWAEDWICFFATLGLSLPSFVALAWARRGCEPKYPAILGAALATVTGSWATVLLLFWCPATTPDHAVAGHACAVAFMGLLGAATGSTVLGVRRGGAKAPALSSTVGLNG
jgi:hypothetical protein